MEKRQIPSLNAGVSLLGFGLMRLPVTGSDKSKIDYSVAGSMVDRAIEGGINYFDTAYVYHERKSEIFAGDVLSKYKRESYYLATKMPTWDAVPSAADVPRVFEKQLKKCKTDYFDFYLVHSFDHDHYEQFIKYNMYDYLSKQKEAGRIRRLGFSFHADPSLLEKVVKNHTWDFAQIQLNYVDWEMLNAKRFYDFLTENRIPVVVMEPVRGGALAALNDKASGILKKAAPQASLASWAIRFAASLPNVMTVLSGMSTPEQLEDNLKTMTPFRPLSEEDYKTIKEAAAAYIASGTVPCTGCRYCMDCPAGVDIPRIFSQYNHYQISKNRNTFTGTYRYLLEKEKAHNCVNCGRCVKLCPQGIDIPKHLKEIAEFAAS
ncbi:MAG: aldo/keto reductase [Treponema sp.]|jgi:predicted aldo/keto reductase-like oxidoreductase|nr:aldo/keto reductase [Treponema sp.]